MRNLTFIFLALFGLSAAGQTFAVRISTNTVLAQGDQVIWSGSAWVVYGKGTNGQVLTMDGTNVVWATPSGGSGSGTVTSVGASTTVSGLGFSGSPVTTSGTLSLTGTVAVASGGTGATDASGARTALSLVPGTHVQVWDVDLDDLADGSLTGSKVGSGIDDDNVSFDDADSLWTATTIGAALEELNDSINAGVPNGTGAKLHWSQLLGVPAGFADGSDDGSGGGSGTMTGISFVVPGPFSISPTSTTTTNTFTLSVSNQTANTVYAGPSSGGAAAPGFRAVVDDDIPNTITIDLAAVAAVANSGDSATAFFSSGTIEEARIDSTIARDSEVTAATAEATLEAVLDLQDLQGAVTDAQVPNTITVDQATLALTGDSATAFFSTGEIEDARLPSGLARDAEVSSTYAPLASPALTGSPTVPTASAGASNTLAASTAYVDRAVASGGGGGGSWDGSPIASGTVTNLTVETINGADLWNFKNGNSWQIWQESHFMAADSFGANLLTWPWAVVALSSGTFPRGDGEINHPGIGRILSSTSANSGNFARLGVNNGLLLNSNWLSIAIFKVSSTNAVIGNIGFGDSLSAADSVDALELVFGRSAQWNYFEGRARSNSTETVTASGYYLSLNTYYRNTIEISEDSSTATFKLYTGEPYPTTLVWSDSITNNIPTGAGRYLGHGWACWTTNATTATELLKWDYIACGITNRYELMP